MRTRDELFRAAQREVAARRQRAVTRAEAARREAVRRHPEIEQAEARRTRLGAAYLMASAQGADITKRAAAQRAFEQAGRDVGDVIRAAGYDPAEFEPRLYLPAVQGHRRGKRQALPVRGRPGPHPAPGGDQRRVAAGAVQL